MGMKRITVALAAWAIIAGPAAAQDWTEVGDAPALIPGQAVVGPPGTDVGFIHGSFLGADDVDLFQIFINRPDNFNANMVDLTSADTQLFLFDINGNGVTHNDDNVVPGVGLTSRLTDQFVNDPGIYYLGVTQYNNDPLNPSGDLIWNNTPFRSERPPDGPGAPGPLNSWTVSTFGAQFTYSIELSGVHFIPEPGTLGMLALGGLCLLRRRR
jgi:hypothetical protein